MGFLVLYLFIFMCRALSTDSEYMILFCNKRYLGMMNKFALCADDVILFLKDAENALPSVLEERQIDMEIFQVVN